MVTMLTEKQIGAGDSTRRYSSMMRTTILAIVAGLTVQAGSKGLAEPIDGQAEHDELAQQQSSVDEGNALAQACISEVLRIHEFFEAWFTGAIERTPENYSKATSALMDNFSQITPDGRYWQREALMSSLEESHGIYSKSDPPFRLWIENPRAVALEGDETCVSVYEEWRQLDGQTRGYITTAILQRFADAPEGVKWLHLQETWLPQFNCCANEANK